MKQSHFLLVVSCCMLVVYVLNTISKYRKRQVSSPAFRHLWNYILTRLKADKALAKHYGCLPPPRLQNQRPFGVDRLEQIFRADTESRLMELFLFHFRQTGNTLEQVFLGTQAFGTVDPANLEAIMSTNFKGWCKASSAHISYSK